LLRRTRVEALPQLINVLRGDLSLVGPQPQRPQLVSALETDVPFYGRRHLVRPGLTGWAQIHPLPGDEADPVATLSRDLFYLKHQSLLLYVFVLLSSIWGGLTGTRRSHAR
jgi:lipopolysaccharide/colanic/teichoic acid biosynthesis glycosyltransferase